MFKFVQGRDASEIAWTQFRDKLRLVLIIAQPWRWNGQVKNFQHDGSREYQVVPPGAEAGGELEGYNWWTAKGPDDQSR